MKYNDKHFYEKCELIHAISFIRSEKKLQKFLKEHNLNYKEFFTFYKKYVLKNYQRLFDKPFHFAKFLNEKGVTRNRNTRFNKDEKFYYPISNYSLKDSLKTAVKKWLEIQNAEKLIQTKLYDFAIKNANFYDLELNEFCNNWNIKESNYTQIRAYCMRKGILVIEKAFIVRTPEELQEEINKQEDERIQKDELTRNEAKGKIKDFVKYYFEGRVKTTQTLKAFKMLNIPLDASIKEIKELLTTK